ncbi:uncharacterized protein LOC130197360 isoform X2 [Pseudoliparis swirei]|uniref:uncharacterized protein LOC130197360 isoform X2 n=1 Tax=Pseudoliparis swirei TaxID=2059687 RepID=UPI0024BE5A6F|nr:uncharacterized protein LOC130197360 isoform X2 [Pseudoliparis swirei]
MIPKLFVGTAKPRFVRTSDLQNHSKTGKHIRNAAPFSSCRAGRKREKGRESLKTKQQTWQPWSAFKCAVNFIGVSPLSIPLSFTPTRTTVFKKIMFKIVEFLETREVEFVPGAWVKDNECLWPALKGKALETAIKLKVNPEPSCMPWTVRQMFTTDNYQEGRRKLREAEERSDLQSDAEDCSGRGARRKIPSRRLQQTADSYLADSEDESGLQQRNNGLPDAPPMSPPKTLTTLHCKTSHQTHAGLNQNELEDEMCQSACSPYWHAEDQRNSLQASHHNQWLQQFESFQEPQKLETQRTLQRPQDSAAVVSHKDSLAAVQVPQKTSSSWTLRRPQNNGSCHETPTSRVDSDHPGPQPVPVPSWSPQAPFETTTSLMREMLTKQEMILEQQTRILQILHARKQDASQFEIDEGLLPVRDQQGLQRLESQLQESDFRSKLINHLSLIGGSDVKDTVWRLMKHTISNTLAKETNWRGVNGKTSMASLQLKTAVIAAVRKNPLTSRASEREVEMFMKRWRCS